IVEFTMDAGGPNPLHIDVQTVDGFIFPLTLTLNNQLGQVGTPLPTMGPGVTRQDILAAYPAFMANQGAAGDAYLPLVFGPGSIAGQAGGIVNPGVYLAGGMNPTSPLKPVWNSTLDTLFRDANTKLSIQGVSAGATPADVYVGGPAVRDGRNVLQLTGATNGQTYYVYDPRTPDPLGPNLNFS